MLNIEHLRPLVVRVQENLHGSAMHVLNDLMNGLIQAERERCAQECELVSQNWSANNDEYKSIALMCAKQIRTGKH